MKNRLIFFLFLVFGTLFSGHLNAQVAVERSNITTKIGGKDYYLHNIKQGQTLWGISQAYNVSIEEIELLNPEVKDGLKAGHVLGIPMRPAIEPKAEEPKSVAVVPEPEPIIEKPEPEPIIEEPEPEPVIEEPEPEPVIEEPEPEPIIEEPEPEPTIEEPEPEPIIEEPEPEPIIEEPEPEPIIEEPEPEPIAETPAETKPQPNGKAFFNGNARILQPGETLYDIAKEYGIDISDLMAANGGLTDEPAAGTRITIPAIANDNDYIIHNCLLNERVTSLLKRWKVDEAEFRRINVSVGSHVFVNQVVLIPIQQITDFYWMGIEPAKVVEETAETPTEDEPIPVQEELVEMQEDIETNLFEDGFGETERCIAAPENMSRRYNVALMVPLYLNEIGSLDVSKENIAKAKKSRPLSFVQFYEGFMMAVERLENEGLKLNLTVMDVTDNISTAEQALSQIRSENYDMIVGPFFSKSFAKVEEYAKTHNIVMVNPLSTRESVIADNPNVVKVKPGELGQILTISNLVKNQYKDSNVFIVSKGKADDAAFLDQLEHRLNLAVNDEVKVSGEAFLQYARNESDRLEMGNRTVSTVDVEGQVYSTSDFREGDIANVVLHNSVKRYTYKDIGKVKSELSGVRNNLIVAYGDDNVFATQMLNSLAKETDRFPITLVCAPDWSKFEKLLVDNLLQMNAIYLSDGFVDYNSDAARQFVAKFRRKYAVEPQSYAFEGYDMGLFFLSALMRYGDDMLDCLNCCETPLLHSRYRFINRNYLSDGMSNGRENQYWSVYQYDKDLIDLKPVDPFKKKTE